MTSLIVGILLFFVVAKAAAQTEYLCNNEIVQDNSGKERCYSLGRRPQTWQEAYNVCHRRGGWLSSGNQSRLIDTQILRRNGITRLWSGQYVQDRRLLLDDFPTPRQTGTFEVKWIANSTIPGDCVLYRYNENDCFTLDSGLKTCKFVNEFVPCHQEHHFICFFEGVRAIFNFQQREIDDVLAFTSADEKISFDIYQSKEQSDAAGSDEVCNKTLPGGTTLRIRSSGEKKIFEEYSAVSSEYEKPVTENLGGLEGIYYWVSRAYNQCVAASMTVPGQTNKPYTLSTWPCGLNLTVLCQREKVYEADERPSVKVNIDGSGARLVNGEIQATSNFMGEVTYGEGSNSSLELQCVCPFINENQGATIYKSRLPVRSYRGQQFYEVPENSYSISLTPGRNFLNPIDFMQSYHCEINNKKNNRLLSSNSVFIRLTDFEVFSVHLPLEIKELRPSFLWKMHKNALLGNWDLNTPGSDSLSLARKRRQISQNGSDDEYMEFLNRITEAFSAVRSNMKPLTFLPNEEKPTLAVYGYGPFRQDIDDQTKFDSFSLLQSFTDEITESFKQRKDEVPGIDVDAIKVVSIDWCWRESRKDETTNRVYSLPQSRMGTVWKSPQICAQDGQPLVTATCEGDKFIGLNWGPLRVNPLCDYSSSRGDETQISISLQTLSQENVTSVNADETVNSTQNLTSQLTDKTVNSKDVNYVADILEKVTEVDELPPSTVQNVLETVSKIKDFPDAILDEAQDIGNATNRILRSVDRLGSRMKIKPSSEPTKQRIISQSLALEVWDITEGYETSHIIGLKILTDGATAAITSDDLVSLFSVNNLDYGAADAAIFLPRDFIQAQIDSNPGSSVRIAMNVYKDTTLYGRGSRANSSTLSLNSRVIAAQLLVDGKPVTSLGTNEVTTVFNPVQNVPIELRENLTTCAYWDYSANQGAGGWANDGCSYNRTEEGRDVCVCEHLTNFAVLVSFYDQETLDNDHELALSIITIIGLSLSIIGLSLSVLSFLLIKKVRQGRPQQTLFNLSLALLMSWIVFLAGIHQTSSHGGCIAVAALLHYLIMASFMWMLMEGILQYLLFVKVMNTYFSNYMLKTGIPAWGFPIIPVVIILAIDTELYRGGEEYCWMSFDAFYYGFAIPVGLIILTNIVIFILVVVSLCRRKDMSKFSSQSANQTVVNVRASFICFCVLGLSWVFGFLAIEDARTVFQYLFCITASLQGFIIFVMMTARDKNVRQYWLSCCCKKNKDASYTSKTGNGSNSQNPMHIPRVQSQREKSISSQANSQTNSTSFTSDDEGKETTFLRSSRKAYGNKENVLF